MTPQLARWAARVAILCLLFNLNFTLVAYWSLFVQTWGTESYIAAFAGPFIGLGCGYLLVSSLRVKDVGIRHATELTTAVRNIAPMLLMMIFPFGADPLVTVSITILNTVGLVGRSALRPDVEARCISVGDARNNQPASQRLSACSRLESILAKRGDDGPTGSNGVAGKREPLQRTAGGAQSCSEGWLARQDSNLEPPDPESGALPLSHAPTRPAF